MITLSFKVPPALEEAIAVASRREQVTRSELVRRAVTAYVARASRSGSFVSALEQAGDLVGCFQGGPKDLASQARHMKGFGRA